MNCSNCGSSAPARAGRCPVCGKPSAAGGVRTGVLTPPVASSDPDVTRLAPPAPDLSASDETRLGGPSEGGDTPSPPVTMGTRRLSQAGGGPLVVGQNFGSRYHIIR